MARRGGALYASTLAMRSLRMDGKDTLMKGKDTLDEGIRHLGVLKAVVVEQKDTSKRALQQDPLSLSLSECSQGRPAPCPREDSCIERAKSRTATLSPRRSPTVDLQGPTRGGTVLC